MCIKKHWRHITKVDSVNIQSCSWEEFILPLEKNLDFSFTLTDHFILNSYIF